MHTSLLHSMWKQYHVWIHTIHKTLREKYTGALYYFCRGFWKCAKDGYFTIPWGHRGVVVNGSEALQWKYGGCSTSGFHSNYTHSNILFIRLRSSFLIKCSTYSDRMWFWIHVMFIAAYLNNNMSGLITQTFKGNSIAPLSVEDGLLLIMFNKTVF